MAETASEKPISVSMLDRLLAAHDGDVALLCLWLLRHPGGDLEHAAGDLCRTRAEMEAALEKLRRMDLRVAAEPAPPLRGGTSEPPRQERRFPPADPPEYTAKDIVERGDPAFTAIVEEAQRVLGHALSTPDLKKLFGLYDYLALPAEVVMTLLHYCAESAGGRQPSMRSIENEAYAWADREIMTLEQAEAYMAAQARRREESAAVARMLGIRDGELTGPAKKHIGAWLSDGFSRELINLAFERTVNNTGALKWSYMNKILQSWKEKGLKTVAEVEEKDLPPRRRNQPVRQPDKPRDIGRLLDELDKI